MTNWQFKVLCALIRVVLKSTPEYLEQLFKPTASDEERNNARIERDEYASDRALLNDALEREPKS